MHFMAVVRYEIYATIERNVGKLPARAVSRPEFGSWLQLESDGIKLPALPVDIINQSSLWTLVAATAASWSREVIASTHSACTANRRSIKALSFYGNATHTLEQLTAEMLVKIAALIAAASRMSKLVVCLVNSYIVQR